MITNASIGPTITARFDSRDLKQVLSALGPKQWNFATAVALTRVGKHVQGAEKTDMRRSLDRPTPYTLNSLYLQRATPANQQARVWFKDFAPKGTPAGKYLMPQVHGGDRSDKRFERSLQRAGYLSRGKQLAPASGIRGRLDQYGNVPRGIYTQILSQLRAGVDATQHQSIRSKRRNLKPGGIQYFYGNPNGRGRGVWMRVAGGRVLGGRFASSIVPVFLEQAPHHYRTRFAFFDVAERTAGATYAREFEQAAAQTIRSAR
jgi:hypothetical protein